LQGAESVAIGSKAGSEAQGLSSVSIGSNSGQYNQGKNSVAIGSLAGQRNQHANTIVINGTGIALNTSSENSCYMSPVADNGCGLPVEAVSPVSMFMVMSDHFHGLFMD
jgi:hypothetical protein